MQLINNTNQNGAEIFSIEQMKMLADEKIKEQQSKLPVQISDIPKAPRFFGKTRFQTNLLKRENMALRNQIVEENGKRGMGFVKVSDTQDALSLFTNTLKKIDNQIKQGIQVGKEDREVKDLWEKS